MRVRWLPLLALVNACVARSDLIVVDDLGHPISTRCCQGAPLCWPTSSDCCAETAREAPEVSIDSPAAGEQVSGEIHVVVTAERATEVLLTMDGAPLGAVLGAPPYVRELDTTSLPDGEHELIAEARGADGTSQIERRTFRVANGAGYAGTVHYFCDCGPAAGPACVLGDDGNSGLSPSEPKRTHGSARTMSMSATCGDRFFFCRGGDFAVTSALWASGSTCSAVPITVGAYLPPGRPGSTPAPRFVVADNIAFYVADQLAGTHGLVFEDIHVVCEGCTRGAGVAGIFTDGEFGNGGVSGVIVRRVEIEGFPWGLHAAGVEGMRIESSYFHDNLNKAILAGGTGAQILYNRFEHNGCVGATDADCLLDRVIDAGGESPRVVGNIFFQSVQDSTAVCAAPVVKSLEANGLLVSDNLFVADGGRDTCVAVDIGESECTDCQVSRNRFVGFPTSVRVHSLAGGRLENNFVLATGPAVGFDLVSAGDATEPASVFNNSLLLTGSLGSMALRADATTRLEVFNNAIVALGDDSTCFSVGVAAQEHSFDNNLCDTPSGAWARVADTAVTLEDWQASFSFDGSSLARDPSFVVDACTTPTSPLLDAGSADHCPGDDLGGTRREGGCDLGAIQWGDGLRQ